MLRRRLPALAIAAVLLLTSPAIRPAAAHAAGPFGSCSLLPADNVWNTDISSLPVQARSNDWLTSSHAFIRNLHPDFGAPPYGIPYNTVTNAHATATFSFLYGSESDSGPYPYGSDLQVEQGSDAHLLSVNTDTCTLYEIGGTDYAGPQTGWAGAVFDLGSNALRPNSWTSADAAGLPILPGLLRRDEIAAGAVRHAIRFTVASTDRSYLWPARHQAGSASDPTLPPMGARFRLRSDFDISSFSPASQVVLTAFKHYGLILADNGSDWFFTGTEDPGWGSGPYPQMVAELKTVPASAFEAVDESGLMIDSNSGQARQPGPPPGPFAYYFTWFDNASVGMYQDNVHILNPASASGAATGYVAIPSFGVSRSFSVAPGQETYVTFPPGTRGGPVVVSSSLAVLASQRVTYQQSFNEVPATSAVKAQGTSYFNWYDRQSAGMYRDDIHVLNPGSAIASGTVAIPSLGLSQPFSVAPQGDSYVNFPAGTKGGPVVVTADHSVISSQRVTYLNSFNEVSGVSGSDAAATAVFSWFDKASDSMYQDNLHLLSAGPAATGTVSIPSLHLSQTFAVNAGGETYVSFPPGTIGGPVVVQSSQPVIASQRVTFGSSFNELRGRPPGEAASGACFNWFDARSDGMYHDDVHVVNPPGSAGTASGTVALPSLGLAQQFTVASGVGTYVTFPQGTIGGPVVVTVTAGPGVLASQRVTYLSSFNEVAGSAC